MIRLIYLTSILFIISFNSHAQTPYDNLHDLSGGITNGYGSWGAFNVIQENSIEITNKGLITFYHPEIIPTQTPTIFFISGWGRKAITYDNFLRFMASHGYSVVHIFNTDPGNITSSYPNALDMMTEAVNIHYPNWIDTSKVGLMGHSFGGGATIWLGNKIFGSDYNWGTNGRFIFMTAPWLSFLTTIDDLQNYPSDVKLLIEINNDDEASNPDYTWNTDERAIRAVYQLINIPNDEKDFVRVISDPTTFEFDSDNNGINETFSYKADHYISYTGVIDNSIGSFHTWDALDVYAINRLAHALIDYVFESNMEAKEVALGNGSNKQIDMNTLTDLIVTDTPIITRSESKFLYQCSSTTGWGNPSIWKLQNYCSDENNDGLLDNLSIKEYTSSHFSLFPVPTSTLLNIHFNEGFENILKIEIFDITGKKLKCYEQPNSYTVDIGNLKFGTYILKIFTDKYTSVERFIVK